MQEIAAVSKIGEQSFAPELRDNRSNSLDDSIQAPIEVEHANLAF